MFGLSKQPLPRSAVTAMHLSDSGGEIKKVDYAKGQPSPVPVRGFRETVPRLTVEELELVYRFSAIVRKGVNKKARDSFRKGFAVFPIAEDSDDEASTDAAAQEWMRATDFRKKSIRASREACVFGDGFLELGFEGNTDAKMPPAAKSRPVKVWNVDPISILPVKSSDTGEIVAYLAPAGGTVPPPTFNPLRPSLAYLGTAVNVRDIDRLAVKRWAEGKGPLPQGVKAIHPSRIVHYQFNTLRDDPDGLGISMIEAAYIASIGKLAGDLSAGDVLEWYSKGFFTLNVEFANQEELDAAKEQLEAAKRARKNYFVGSERAKFDIKTPALANIKQFYDVFYIELAAALEIPVTFLAGIQKGAGVGTESELTEYYDDVAAFQELLLEAPLLAVFRRVLGRDDLRLAWTQIYVNKQTQADVAFKRAQATAQLFGAKILSRREAIKFMRDGVLPNPDEVPEAYSEKSEPPAVVPGEPAPPKIEDDEDEDDDEAEALGRVLPLSALDREQIARERALGERILGEQAG